VTAAASGLFETMRRVAAELPLLDAHLARLLASARALSFADLDEAELRRRCLERALEEHRRVPDDAILRLEVGSQGQIAFDARPLRARTIPLRVDLVVMPAGTFGGRHKTVDRSLWDAIRAQSGEGSDDGVLVQADGDVLEATVANVFAWVGGAWVTPRADGRILPGIGRAWALARMRAAGLDVEERRLSVEELHDSRSILLTNAVYGARLAVLRGRDGDGESSPPGQLPSCLVWPPGPCSGVSR
jgi:para-aminobenzoate synthetase/4-amino-4-deoxychorismate lyase